MASLLGSKTRSRGGRNRRTARLLTQRFVSLYTLFRTVAAPYRRMPRQNSGANAMLTVHHLGRSQSERIVWLCEELLLDYELKRYGRDPATRLAPPEYKALHPIGTAPVVTDGGLVLGESGAIIEYIIAKYGGGRLARQAGHPEFADYLYWFHYANASFQALLHRALVARLPEPPPDHRVLLDLQARLGRALDALNRRLGEADYLAGR